MAKFTTAVATSQWGYQMGAVPTAGPSRALMFREPRADLGRDTLQKMGYALLRTAETSTDPIVVHSLTDKSIATFDKIRAFNIYN